MAPLAATPPHPVSPALVSSALLSRWWSLLILISIAPLAWPDVPPLTDLPAHMARIMVQVDAGRSADIARWYSFAWDAIPNLGTDLIAQVLVPAIGLKPAMKAIVILIVALQSAGFLLLARAAHGKVTAPALFALPLAYAAPLQHGFLNFAFASALATLALALWISPRLSARPLMHYALFTAIGCALWISHLAGWAILCVAVGCCELAARWRGIRSMPNALAGGFARASCLLIPQVLALLLPNRPARLPTHGFFHWDEKLYFLTNVLADRWNGFDALSALAVISVIVVVSVSARFVMHRGLALSAAVLFALYWLLPTSVFGTYYTDMRLLPAVAGLALVAARERADVLPVRWLALAGLAFLGVRLVGTTVSMAMWDRQIRAEVTVVDRVPRGAQLVSFTALPCRTFILQDRVRDIHLASYALIRRHAFANDQFSMPGGQLMTIHNDAAIPFDRDPSSIEIGETCQGTIPVLDSAAKIPAAIPYLWIVWHTPRLDVPGWKPVAEKGNSVLYHRVR